MTKRYRVYFGGSFNPVHCGHVAILEHVCHTLKQYTKDFVLYALPTAQNPFKSAPILAHHRVAMLKMAVSHIAHIDATELDSKIPTYTIDTLNSLKNQHPNDTLIFVIGQDSLDTLPSWKHYQDITLLANLWVLPRLNPQNNKPAPNSFLHSKITYQFKDLLQKQSQIYLDTQKIPHISSSQIRQALAVNRKDLNQYLPSDVLAYIKENRLYKSV